MRTEIVPASDAGLLIERIIAVRDPVLAKGRRERRLKALKDWRDRSIAIATQEAQARRSGLTIRSNFLGEPTLPEGMTLAEYKKTLNAEYKSGVARAKSGDPGRPRWEVAYFSATGIVEINRPLAEARVQLYAEEMVAGRWYDSPDPIVVSEEGYLVNGQHRLLAATRVEWDEEGDEVPDFLVVWDAHRTTALLMDEAVRSTKDRRHIALGYAVAS